MDNHPAPIRTGTPPFRPTCTYRLQIEKGFDLGDAAKVAPYLEQLGVDAVYTSPLLQSAPGSRHGYDCTSPHSIDAERGGERGYELFASALRLHRLRHVIDVVPNHMSTKTPENRWWWDVLRHGRASKWAGCFDIEWDAASAGRRGVVVLPILGESAEEALRHGSLRTERGSDGWVLRYYEHTLPLEGIPADQEGPEPRGDRLAHLLERQTYQLLYWKDGEKALNYRRFFDVDSLAAVRIEDPDVFEAIHEWVLRALEDGRLGGLRIDHPDGLSNPSEYFERLATYAKGAWTVVEKILEPGEALRSSWPVDGTTGYDFLNTTQGLFIDPRAEPRFTEIYGEVTGAKSDWEAEVLENKRRVLSRLFLPELARLDRILDRLAPEVGVDPADLRNAMVEMLVRFPVYRSYIEPRPGPIDPSDIAWVDGVASAASDACPDLTGAIAAIAAVLLDRRPCAADLRASLVTSFQQTTGPLMAKGVEDTAFYCYAHFIALNEVGGCPGRFGVTPHAFHEDCAQRQELWPDAMLATSTHDTKRSEDVRARLCTLSEIPDAWRKAILRWRDLNQRHRRGELPDPVFEYFFYQTLVGAHPLPIDRALPYFEKVIREAKHHTSWRSPDPAYEDAVRSFITNVLSDETFLSELDDFVRPLIVPGRLNSLAHTLLKLTAPGIPDIYQGCELWDFSLVDPDNRRPVDFDLRQRLLEEVVRASRCPESPSTDDLGVSKLWVVQRTLELRKRRPEIFGSESRYSPLQVTGDDAHHVIAFTRRCGRSAIVSVVPRLNVIRKRWGTGRLELPGGRWRNVLADFDEEFSPSLDLADLFRNFPVALLESMAD